MPIVPVEEEHTSKPEGSHDVSPKFKGRLVVGWLINDGNAGPRSFGKHKERGTLSGATGGIDNRGRVIIHDNVADSTVLLSEVVDILPTGPITICIGYKKRDGTNRASGLFGVNSGSSNHRCGVHGPFSDGTVYWDYGGAVEGTTRVSVAGLTFGDDDWSYTVGPRGMEIWQNGIRRGNNAANPTRTQTATTPFELGLHATTGDSDLVNYRYLYVFEGQLSKGEIREIARNPWIVVEADEENIALPEAAAGITGSAASTNANDSQAAAGTLEVSGSAASTNTNDIQAAAGTLEASGTAASTNADDGQVAAGELTNSGAASSTNANATQTAVGTVTTPGIVGAASSTNANDSQAAVGQLTVSGTAASTNASDIQAASGIVGAVIILEPGRIFTASLPLRTFTAALPLRTFKASMPQRTFKAAV